MSMVNIITRLYPITKPPVLPNKKAPGEAEKLYLVYFSHFFSFNSISSFL